MAARRTTGAATRGQVMDLPTSYRANLEEAGPPTIQDEIDAYLDVHIMKERREELVEERMPQREEPFDSHYGPALHAATMPAVPGGCVLVSALRDERGNSHAEAGHGLDEEYDTHALPLHL